MEIKIKSLRLLLTRQIIDKLSIILKAKRDPCRRIVDREGTTTELVDPSFPGSINSPEAESSCLLLVESASTTYATIINQTSIFPRKRERERAGFGKRGSFFRLVNEIRSINERKKEGRERERERGSIDRYAKRKKERIQLKLTRRSPSLPAPAIKAWNMSSIDSVTRRSTYAWIMLRSIREFSWRAFDMQSVKMPAASRKHAVCRLKLDGQTASSRLEISAS